MVYVVEAFVEDYLHVLANVNLIKIFKNVFPTESFVFISAKKHNDQVKVYFEEQQSEIFFQSIPNLISSGNFFARLYRVPFRFFRDIRLINNILKKCKPGDSVVITHIHFVSLVLLKVIKKSYPEVTLFSVIHGDVEYAFFPKNKQQELVGFFHKWMFNIKAKNFYYVFLTQMSTKILVDSNSLQSSELFSIELPTFPNGNKYVLEDFFPKYPLKIGHIGSAGLRKNVQLIYELATRVQESIVAGNLELSLVGVLDDKNILPFLNPLVVDYVNNEVNKPLLRSLYDEKISGLHYSIFFYGKNDFILRSSAAFFDAIYYEKPIIALRNTFFDDVFKREGAIGYLCDNLEEMATLIQNFAAEKEKYDQQYILLVQNIKKYKSKLSIHDISLGLKEEFEFKKIL